MLGFTDLRDTRLRGRTLHTWQTIDQGPYSARSLTVREVTLYVVDTSGGQGEPPESRGFLTQGDAEAAAETYMGREDGRGIRQDWRRVGPGSYGGAG